MKCVHEWYDNPSLPFGYQWCIKCYSERKKPQESPVVKRNLEHREDKFSAWRGSVR